MSLSQFNIQHSTFNISSVLIALLAISCSGKVKVDLIIHNARIYTVDSAFTVGEAFAVRDGKFIAVGTNKEILDEYSSDSVVDVKGKAVFPGLIDAHSHFIGYAKTKLGVDLVGTKSYAEVIQRVVDYHEQFPNEEWIQGRGWDQNDWEVKQWPDRALLDSLFPNNPIILKRVDGHAALVNAAAMRRAGINVTTKVDGGRIEIKQGLKYTERLRFLDPESIDGLSGILIDNAVDLVTNIIPEPDVATLMRALKEAEEDCFAVGLTGVCDAGQTLKNILLLDSLQKAGELSMRIYAMHDPKRENIDYVRDHGILKTDHLNVRSFKMYADGSLGSRSAWLLEDYSDDPRNRGLNTLNADTFHVLASLCIEKNMQMCVHAIGDAAVRMVLDSFDQHLDEDNDHRWRIEHCQVLSQFDPVRFASKRLVASIQPTHATSDMYWAGDRLGQTRVKLAYAYMSLLSASVGHADSKTLLALGSDFPVESINPLFGLFAAVARKDQTGWPEDGWQIENALTREVALRGMTIWAAHAQFEENERGSIETGKFADFFVLDKDVMTCPEMEIFGAKVLMTHLGGKRVF
jgi:predicted amidohydrolase YtcJ